MERPHGREKDILFLAVKPLLFTFRRPFWISEDPIKENLCVLRVL